MRLVDLALLATTATASTIKNPSPYPPVELDPSTHHRLLLSGRPQVGLWKALLKDAQAKQAGRKADLSRNADTNTAQTTFSAQSHNKPHHPSHCFNQPISHFDAEYNTTFCQRYWVDASSYKPGGPVFLLDGGETSGANRLPFLESGILEILSTATNGLSIVLEHRYYGKSVPVPSFSTDDLRWLNNEEALEDSANFIRHWTPPPGLLPAEFDPTTLRADKTPWIYYGGSYAGARAAHMRVQYPELVWGAIASSAVTHAQINFPQYFDPIQSYGPPECIEALQSSIKTIDRLLDMPAPVPDLLKGLFGLPGLGDADFGEVISGPLGYWQGKNWDPAVGSDGFQHFCDALTAGGAGSSIGLIKIPAEIMNYANYIKSQVISECPPGDSTSGAPDVINCFGTDDDYKFQDTGLDQTWRLWLFQVCTQWGYFMPAPEEGPSIVSSKVDLAHTSKICKQAYPPGLHFAVPKWPDVESVNARGDYAIEADRLAFIDGDRDPWRVMSDLAPKRTSTVSKPVHLIFDGVHHYDENGLRDHTLEPARIRDVHELEKNFISEWVAQFHEEKAKGV